ncbi:hypothetical protein BH11BAC3_BH11BAC3_31640 [soil metagenome]
MNHNKDYEEIVLCLYDQKFHLGVAVLANSLVKSGFKGLIRIGHRDEALPEWVGQLEFIGEGCYVLSPGIRLCFTRVNTKMHLGYYKPYFLKEAIDAYSSTNRFYYFDVDIAIKAPWSVFANWLDKDVCLCLDNSFHYLHHKHPWRKEWRKIYEGNEINYNDTSHYYNSGFIGIERNSAVLIDRWILITEKFKMMGGNMQAFIKDAFISFKGDQDILNAAITVSADVEISTMGREGMGFTLPASLMWHAIGDVKPWDKLFLFRLISLGQGPSMAERMYFNYCKFPIRVFKPLTFKIKMFDLRGAALLGRFIG